MWNIGDVVFDAVDCLEGGKIIDIYTNYLDDPNGVTMYIVDFGNDEVFDRLSHELV